MRPQGLCHWQTGSGGYRIRPYNHSEVCNAPRRAEDCPPYISGILLIAL